MKESNVEKQLSSLSEHAKHINICLEIFLKRTRFFNLKAS